jgi:uncharacterized membrane protein YuzA (DUF378 family)
MRGMSILSKIGLLAAAVGAANWLAVGVWHYNFIAAIFGSGTQSATGGERIIYIVFGVGAVLCLPLLAAALGSAPSGRRSTAEEEPTGQAARRPLKPSSMNGQRMNQLVRSLQARSPARRVT